LSCATVFRNGFIGSCIFEVPEVTVINTLRPSKHISIFLDLFMMEGIRYSEEEISVIQTVFDSCDGDRVGRIHINQLGGLLMKLGKDDGEVLLLVQ
jgi:hypothetical protein